MTETVAGRIMPIIAVPSVDATRNFYVDTLGFRHVMGMIGKDGQLDFLRGRLGDGQHHVQPGAGYRDVAREAGR